MSHRQICVLHEDLDPAEAYAVRWALTAAGSVVQRAVRDGRMPDGQVSISPVDHLDGSLRAGILDQEDLRTILAALRFAASLYEPGLADIRQALDPPSAGTIASAMGKLIASVGKETEQLHS